MNFNNPGNRFNNRGFQNRDFRNNRNRWNNNRNNGWNNRGRNRNWRSRSRSYSRSRSPYDRRNDSNPPTKPPSPPPQDTAQSSDTIPAPNWITIINNWLPNFKTTKILSFFSFKKKLFKITANEHVYPITIVSTKNIPNQFISNMMINDVFASVCFCNNPFGSCTGLVSKFSFTISM